MTERQQISRRDVTYIQQYWEPLAAVAWSGHLTQDAGAVVIDRRVEGAPLISYADQPGSPHRRVSARQLHW